jgi:hypothetical protein
MIILLLYICHRFPVFIMLNVIGSNAENWKMINDKCKMLNASITHQEHPDRPG